MSEHAHCGPSSSEGWLNCCSYATLTRGLQRKATFYTREGSAAHAVSELKLKGLPVPEFIHIEGEDILVTEEMLEYCDVYVQFAQMLMFGASLAIIEGRVSMDWLYEPATPPEVVFGTADLIVYDDKTRTLYVVDFKFGQGYVVKAKRNPQLMLYALMALGLLPEMPINIALIIVQPRASKEQISRDDMLLSELTGWFQKTVKPALARIGAGDTSENPGDWCRWCLRLASCGSLQKKAQAVAKLSFSSETPSAPPQPASLSSDDIAAVLNMAELISAWVSKVRAEAMARIEAGETVPGFKLVQKRGVRKWIDETEVEKLIVEHMGVSEIDALHAPELKSPAQIEKLFKRIGMDFAQLEQFISKESSGVSLVPDTDEREEKQVLRISASSVFEAVEDGDYV